MQSKVTVFTIALTAFRCDAIFEWILHTEKVPLIQRYVKQLLSVGIGLC